MKAKVFKKSDSGQWSLLLAGEAMELTDSHARVQTFSKIKGEVAVNEWFSLDSARIKVELEPITVTDPVISDAK